MDPSLALLARLQRRGRLRRWRRSLGSPKGIVFAVISAILIAWWIGSVGFAMRFGGQAKASPATVRSQGPVLLMAITVLTVAIGNGGRALYFAPAEEAFLFAGPYRRRQLIGYKLRAVVVGCLFSAAILTLATMTSWTSPVAAYVALFLISLFLELVAVVAGLAAGVVGAMAWDRAKRGVVAVVIAAVAWGAGSSLGDLTQLSWAALFAGVARSPVAAAIATPFRVFIEAFAAERAWPDFLPWAAGAAAIDLALLGLVFALDAGYLEVASASSARTYAKLQKMRAGGGTVRAVSARKAGGAAIRLPAPAWWGGVGPNFWRQMTTALGSPGRIVMVIACLAAPVVGLLGGAKGQGPASMGPALGMVAWISLFLGVLLPYDFRGDMEQMEFLKSLPIPPARLALGQLLAPTLIATAAQAVVMAVLLGMGGARPPDWAWSVLAFLLPLNLLLMAVENLLFLWYPSRPAVGQFEITAMGRQVMFLLAKFLGVAIGAGAAAGVGAGAYFLAGGHLPVALGAGWAVLAAVALAMVPWVGRAFVGYDVASDTPA